MIRLLWLAVRSAFVLGAMTLTFFDGLSWAVLPGRFALELVGAAGPELGKYAVVLSGLFYAGAALVATIRRRQVLEPDVALDLA